MNPFLNSISNQSILTQQNNTLSPFNNHILNHLQSLQSAQPLSHFSNPNLFNQLSQTQSFLNFSPNSSRQTSPRELNIQALLSNPNLGIKFPQNNPLQAIPPHLHCNFNSPRNNTDLANQVNNLLLSWKLQNNLQTEFYKKQLSQLAEMQKDLSSKLAAVQNLPISKIEHKSSPDSDIIKYKHEEEEPVHYQPMTKKTLRGQIRGIIQFVLPNYGRISESQMEHEKEKYEDPDLRAVFDVLMAKYSSTIKTKEEMIKYTLRRAFKYIKKGVKKEMKLDSKEAANVLCNKYFKEATEQIPDFQSEESFLRFLLPFRKCSKNKTMNSSFIQEVFSSEEFQKDYQTYLEDLDEILEADNNGKIERFVYFIEDCIKKKRIQEIKKYKRIPWPEIWIANTKKIAIELPGGKLSNNPSTQNKKIKKGPVKMVVSPLGSATAESENDRTTQSSPKLST